MASAESFYVDVSALRSAYVHDDRSKRFCGWRSRRRMPLVITRHGRAELTNSILLGVFRGVYDAHAAGAALADLEADLVSGRLELVDPGWRRAFDEACALTRGHTAALGTRTLDVLHVASARILEKRVFVTYDDRQAALARAAGLRALAP